MATFPSLQPDSISYDLGAMNISEVETPSAGPIRFRHSLAVDGNVMRLAYTNLTQAQVALIRTHYNASAGTHDYFDLPVALWGGVTVTTSDSLYRYTSPPAEQQKGIYFDVTVALRIQAGNLLLYILNGNTATQPAVSAFTSFALTGNQPFILNGNAADLTSAAITHIFEGGGAS